MHAIFINLSAALLTFLPKLDILTNFSHSYNFFSQRFPFKLKNFRVCQLLVWENIIRKDQLQPQWKKNHFKTSSKIKFWLKTYPEKWKNEKLYDSDSLWCPNKWNNNIQALRTIETSLFVTCIQIFINYQQFCYLFCQNWIFSPTSTIRKILFSQLFPFKLRDIRVLPLLVWENIIRKHQLQPQWKKNHLKISSET